MDREIEHAVVLAYAPKHDSTKQIMNGHLIRFIMCPKNLIQQIDKNGNYTAFKATEFLERVIGAFHLSVDGPEKA